MQDRGNPENEVNAEQVLDSLGEGSEVAEEAQAESVEQKDELPKFAKEKLGMQEKRHKKEMRRLQQQIEELKMQFGSSNQPEAPTQNQMDQQMPSTQGNDLQQAIAQAMHTEKKRQKDAENAQHLKKQYDDLQDKLDKGIDKYDDFDEVVMSPRVPFTAAMRDAALLIPNGEDVLYKLGKNPDDLKRISNLPNIQQAQELVKLSIALMSGGDNKAASQGVKTMGNIKNNPVSNSSQITEKSSVGDIRRRMKAGWK